MKRLIVTGEFDDNGGRPSKIGHKLAELLDWPSMNGGHLRTLESFNVRGTGVLLWMPQITNDHTKFLPRLKAQSPHLLLISSKRCRDKYTDSDVIGRLLQSKSNLGIAIFDRPHVGRVERSTRRRYSFKLLDPLGNQFVDTDDLIALADAINSRVGELTGITRCGSHSVGPVHDFTVDPDFLAIVHYFGQKFASYVNAINPNRYLGNASTRCASGFPAERQGDTILVSRRNVSKDDISSSDFVELLAHENGDNRVLHWGKQKPSVDAPIQIRLFEHYPAIRFMIHGHVYVKGAPMTKSKLPCGAIEEYHEITDIVPTAVPTDTRSRETSAFAVNLRGHGCIIACSHLGYFDTIELEARPFPES